MKSIVIMLLIWDRPVEALAGRLAYEFAIGQDLGPIQFELNSLGVVCIDGKVFGSFSPLCRLGSIYEDVGQLL